MSVMTTDTIKCDLPESDIEMATDGLIADIYSLGRLMSSGRVWFENDDD